MQAVAGVVVEVAQVHQGGLGQVVVGQVEVADLGGHHRLAAADSDESRTVSRS